MSERDRGSEYPWLQGLCEGDLEAREAFSRYAIHLTLGWCTRLAPPGLDPEDVAQEVVIVALGRTEQLDPAANVNAWLFAITRRVMANHRNRAWFRKLRFAVRLPERLADESDAPDRALDTRRRSDLAHQCLEHLRPRHREVLVLYYLEERSAEEVGEILGIKPQAVRALALRARKNMAKAARKLGYKQKGQERT